MRKERDRLLAYLERNRQEALGGGAYLRVVDPEPKDEQGLREDV